MILALGVLVLATLITVIMLVRDVYGLFSDVADWSMAIYRIGVDVWLIGILPVTPIPVPGRQSLVPLLVPPGQVDGSNVQPLRQTGHQPLPHRVQ